MQDACPLRGVRLLLADSDDVLPGQLLTTSQFDGVRLFWRDGPGAEGV